MKEEILKFDLVEKEEETYGPVIKVMGIGGCGCNIIHDMVESGVLGAELIAVNTDLKALNSRMAHEKIQIGKKLTKGLGSGSKPEVGEKAAEEDREVLEKELEGTDLLFIAAGLGGGTGSGAGPVIADIARSMNILTVAVVITPFKREMEQSQKKIIVDESLKKLTEKVNNVIVISNDKVIENCENLRCSEAYKEANKVLISFVNGLIGMVARIGIQNIDFADIKTTLREKGKTFIGIGRASGTDRAQKALNNALNNPFIGEVKLSGAKHVLVNFIGDIITKELSVVDELRKLTGDKASIKYGVVEDLSLGDEIEIVILVSGINETMEMEIVKSATDKFHKMELLARQLVESGYENVDTPSFERYPN
ncbi:MAG: cell division protein FtsZ [Candidatus Goldbacteria bacterium]|nr:cell division protein FtsZ [Candidatus Goldiibacteriota bacterium]